VVLTDGHDLESYGLTTTCLEHLAKRGFQKRDDEAAYVLPWIVAITRPIGLLRIASARHALNLPFQRTFGRGLSRFIVGAYLAAMVDISRVISTLIQNAGISLARAGEIGDFLTEETQAQIVTDDYKIVHGKDFIRSLAWLFDIDQEDAEPMLFLSMNYAEIRAFPNIQKVEDWVRP
jgi:hypothetical protein